MAFICIRTILGNPDEKVVVQKEERRFCYVDS